MSFIVVRLAAFRLGIGPSHPHGEKKPAQNGALEIRTRKEIQLSRTFRNRCPRLTEIRVRDFLKSMSRTYRNPHVLVTNITSGREYHSSIVPLAARMLGGGMYPAAVVNHLRELMDGVSPDARDQRWVARRADIPRVVETAKSKWGANEPEPECQLRLIAAATFAGSPVPARAWHVPELVPARTVTILGGDGGTGKSLLALQLAAATATGTDWIGLPVSAGASLYLSAEDDIEELHRRLVDITAGSGLRLDQMGSLHILPLADRDAILAAPEGRQNLIRPTPLWRRLEELVAEVKPELVILDNLADLFAGDENSRTQARQFVGLLRTTALRHDAAIVVLSHPSLSGITSGSGSSGSTAWSNSVRSRLYLSRVSEDTGGDVDADLRVLTTKKANYGRAGADIRIRWVNGMFKPEFDPASQAGLGSGDTRADRIFLDLLDRYEAQGRHVSATPSANYAPTVFAREPEARGTNKKALVASMNRHFQRGVIIVDEFGPPSRRLKKIVRAERCRSAEKSPCRKTPAVLPGLLMRPGTG